LTAELDGIPNQLSDVGNVDSFVDREGANLTTELDGIPNQLSDVGNELVGGANSIFDGDRSIMTSTAEFPATDQDAGFVEEAGHHLDETLGRTLDASTMQGTHNPTPGPDEIAAPFIPGGSVLSAAELDEDDPKPIDTEDA